MGNAASDAGAVFEEKRTWRVRISVYLLVGNGGSDALLSAIGAGLYHSGVEIEGVEYAYGGGGGSGTGVWAQKPRIVPPGFTKGSFKESLDISNDQIGLHIILKLFLMYRKEIRNY